MCVMVWETKTTTLILNVYSKFLVASYVFFIIQHNLFSNRLIYINWLEVTGLINLVVLRQWPAKYLLCLRFK